MRTHGRLGSQRGRRERGGQRRRERRCARHGATGRQGGRSGGARGNAGEAGSGAGTTEAQIVRTTRAHGRCRRTDMRATRATRALGRPGGMTRTTLAMGANARNAGRCKGRRGMRCEHVNNWGLMRAIGQCGRLGDKGDKGDAGGVAARAAPGHATSPARRPRRFRPAKALGNGDAPAPFARLRPHPLRAAPAHRAGGAGIPSRRAGPCAAPSHDPSPEQNNGAALPDDPASALYLQRRAPMPGPATA